MAKKKKVTKKKLTHKFVAYSPDRDEHSCKYPTKEEAVKAYRESFHMDDNEVLEIYQCIGTFKAKITLVEV